MSFVPVNPRPMLQDLVDKTVSVRLKWGQTEYQGVLKAIDSYMNLQLAGTKEFIDCKKTGDLGQVLIRWVISLSLCLSLLFFSPWLTGPGATTCSGSAASKPTKTEKTP